MCQGQGIGQTIKEKNQGQINKQGIGVIQRRISFSLEELVGKKLTHTALSCPSMRQVTAAIWNLWQSNCWKHLKCPDDTSGWLSGISSDRHEHFLLSPSANFSYKVITPAALWYLIACKLAECWTICTSGCTRAFPALLQRQWLISHSIREIRTELLLGPGGKLSHSHLSTATVWISGTRDCSGGGWRAQSLLWPDEDQCLPKVIVSWENHTEHLLDLVFKFPKSTYFHLDHPKVFLLNLSPKPFLLKTKQNPNNLKKAWHSAFRVSWLQIHRMERKPF